MELNEIIEKAKTDHQLSQNALAQRIGMTRGNLSSVLHGRRRLPAEAAIELFDLTGIHPREILKAAVRTTSCIALAVVLLFGTGAENSAYASKGFDAAKSQEYKLSWFGRRWMRAARRVISRVLRGIAGLASPPQNAGSIVCAR